MIWTHGGSHIVNSYTNTIFAIFGLMPYLESAPIGADSKYGISFALNNDPVAQSSCKLRIITAEMSYGNGPWHS